MRRAFPLLFLLAIPLWAADGDQSYISYDEGQSIVRQGYDGREIEARLNLPIFAGDQIVTGRRGRTEIRLADGSVIALDRESALEITSVGNEFESQDERSVVNLRRGAAIVHLQSDDDAALRLDSPVASYASLTAGIYSVEVDARGRDQVTVLSGSTEVRTQRRAYRLRAGETARVDADGIYDIQAVSGAESSFERWYLNRVDRYQGRRARYLDSRYAWVEADLADHGDWVYVGEFGWVWRPYVVAGWRPYYHGSWIWGPRGHMIWSSYEPWGWYPYHYGRWTYSGIYGWVWLPGYRYSPAWVYWAYGPSWIGWAPSGWYDCYRPYNWIWNGYGSGRIVDVGFFGRVNLVGSDLSGWTILESGTIVSTRVDRAALSLDAARARMARDGGHGIFSSSPVRFTREDIKNPAAAVGRVSRLGVGGGTGKEGSGSLTDLTSFFRRDPELSPAVRSSLDRSKIGDAARRMVVPTPAPDRSTSLVPSRSLGGATGRAGGGTVMGRSAGEGADRPAGGRVDRGGSIAPQPRQGTITRPAPSGQTPSTSGRVERGTSDSPRADSPRGRVITRESGDGAVRRAQPAETPRAPESTPRSGSDDSWRGRVIRSESQPAPTRELQEPVRREIEAPAPRESEPPAARESEPPPQRNFDRGESDWRSQSSYRSGERASGGRSDSAGRDTTPIPRQVIDSIGGARIVPNRDSGSSSRGESRGRISAPRGSSSPGASSGPSRSGGSSGGSVSRPAPSAPSHSAPSHSNAPSRGDGGSKSNMRKD